MNVITPQPTVEGRATYGMANLRRERTGLPCVAFISQRDAARHDVRVKVATGPRVRPDEPSSYALRPFRLAEGPGLPSSDERALERWVAANLPVLVDHWDGTIAYTEDALDLLKPV